MHTATDETPTAELAAGMHERCNNPFCRASFPFTDGKFTRMKALDGKFYCDAFCGSGPYLTKRRHSGC
jgi:hypothetical protein